MDWLCPQKEANALEKYFIPNQSPNGTLVKSPDNNIVYLIGNDIKKHPFADPDIYNSWKINEENVQLVSNEFINSFEMGKSVQFKPGTLVKTDNNPRVYLVGDEWDLHWLANENVARSLYGSDWNKNIKIISESLFADYSIASDIIEFLL